jgi:ABC-type Mn2+/Zn2+ transport system ATPase subunit
LLELESAAFGYGAGFTVKNVTLRIEAGDFVLLSGVNGSGKTTIIRGILGLVRKTAGSVRRRISADRIGYVPQESVIHPDIPATALDVVRIGRSTSWTGGREKAMEALSTVGMQAMAKTRFGRLSGGQKRRVLLAKALVRDPLLLILDEPTANVDRDTAVRIESLLYQLTTDSGVGVLAAGHSDTWAARARRIPIGNGAMA